MQGLWAFERNLIVDPHTAAFPLTCLFTGTPVEETTLMTVAQVDALNQGPLTGSTKRQTQLSLPVILSYRRERAEWSKKVRSVLVVVAMALTLGGITFPLLMKLEGEALGGSISFALGFAVLALIVGCCFPHLDDMNGSKYISGVRFLKDGRILIPKVHESVLAGLPELERGFLDGFLGNESLNPKGE